jgi:hypothetical protein
MTCKPCPWVARRQLAVSGIKDMRRVCRARRWVDTKWTVNRTIQNHYLDVFYSSFSCWVIRRYPPLMIISFSSHSLLFTVYTYGTLVVHDAMSRRTTQKKSKRKKIRSCRGDWTKKKVSRRPRFCHLFQHFIVSARSACILPNQPIQESDFQ